MEYAIDRIDNIQCIRIGALMLLLKRVTTADSRMIIANASSQGRASLRTSAIGA